jgi:prepilin-type N-terminal cleavage/methylation domain-containing protein
VNPDSRAAGFTVVELLVVMVVLGIIGSVVTTALVQGMRHSAKASARVTRELRAACPVEGPVEDYATSVAVLRGGAWWRYGFSQPAGTDQLRVDRDRWDGAADAWIDDSEGVVTDGLSNRAAGAPVFAYLERDGSPTTTPADVDRIELTLRRKGSRDAPVVVETAVDLRNGGRPCPTR